MRQDYRGAAAALALTADLNDTAALTFAVSGDTSGWPSGASGRSFVAILDRNTAKEEKVLCATLSSGTMTLSQRGYDGGSGKTHSSGAIVEHIGPSADKMDDLDAHVYDPTRDDHSQYVPTNGTRGFSGVDQLTGSPSSVGGSQNSSGSGLTLSRSDHGHGILQGGIDDSGMFAPGVVTAVVLGAASVGNTSVLAGGVRLEWVAANSTALAALTPAVGDLAYQVDAGALFVRRTSDWSIVAVKPQQQVVTGGTTNGTSEFTVSTLTLAAIPASYMVECSAHWSVFNTVDLDQFVFRVKVDGTEKGIVSHRFAGGANIRGEFSIPSTTFVTIAANTASTITATVQRTSGTGGVTSDQVGVLTARLWPL